MTIIQWLSKTRGEVREWLIGRPCVSMFRGARIDGRIRKVFAVSLVASTMIGYGLPPTAWTADLSSFAPLQQGKVVSAGIGYENAETSTITVKTYDAESGAILSEETYELNVREDAASTASQPRERIFAGGVGPGADGLSAFTLRVYDAATGRFLWEGFLDLTAGDQEAVSPHRVVAHLAPQTIATQVRSRGVAIDGQPQLFLRAVDSATGQLVWTDQFSAGAGRRAYAERVGRAVVGQAEGFAASSQQIELRIRMFNGQDWQLLWEDRIEPAVDDTEVLAGQNDTLGNLPAWRRAGSDEMKKEAI